MDDRARGDGSEETGEGAAEVVASSWTVRDGRIVAGTEHWTTLGGEQAPAWREQYARPRGAG